MKKRPWRKMKADKRIREHLRFLYGEARAGNLEPQLAQRLQAFSRRNPHLSQAPQRQAFPFSEQDAVVITYGDHIREEGRLPLQSLAAFLEKHLKNSISSIHLLPFYPYSSDDGFSVIDYRQVDGDLGSWDDVARIGENFRLMFDLVINHVSRQSRWFQGFVRGEAPFTGYFITVDPGADLSQVVRPRALPLLTPVETGRGVQHVWTTFSDDQIDLNYGNPQVLLEMVGVLLFYVERGASIIRLDAIAYLWKEVGAASIHLPETHRVVKLLRAVLDAVAPNVTLITETNVPHVENVSYFGEPLPGGGGRTDEAQLVYQFPLAPLVLHTFHTGSARALSEWAASLETPGPASSFFNFIASHDGIGVRPAEGLLERAEIMALAERALAHGGLVSYRSHANGSRSPYELNITLYDALNDPSNPDEELDVRRFLASQAIMLSLAGVPGIYLTSLFGARNCYACRDRTGLARSINREKFRRAELEQALSDPATTAGRVFEGYRRLLRLRRERPAFSPLGEQRILQVAHSVFALARRAPDESETVVCLVSVAPRPQRVALAPASFGLPTVDAWRDLIGEQVFTVREDRISMELEGYQAAWLLPLSL